MHHHLVCISAIREDHDQVQAALWLTFPDLTIHRFGHTQFPSFQTCIQSLSRDPLHQIAVLSGDILFHDAVKLDGVRVVTFVHETNPQIRSLVLSWGPGPAISFLQSHNAVSITKHRHKGRTEQGIWDINPQAISDIIDELRSFYKTPDVSHPNTTLPHRSREGTFTHSLGE